MGSYDLTHEIKMKVTIYGRDDHFNIPINDKFFYDYKYRKQHGTIRKIQFAWDSDRDTSVVFANRIP